MTKQTYRRRAGLLFGSLIGLIFGLLSQLINPLLLPGVPLFQPPFGPAGNFLLLFLAGGLLGLMCSWIEGSMLSVVVLSGISAAALLVIDLLVAGQGLGLLPVRTIGVLFLWIPFTGMFIIVLGLLRVAVNQMTDSRTESFWRPANLWLPLAILIAAGGVGWSVIFSSDARAVVQHNHQMLQQGLAASSMAAMPPPLTGPEMQDFSSRAGESYTLAWENKNLTAYAIPRPSGPEYLMSVAIARFDNGWNVVCLYPTADTSEPRCRSFNELP